MLIEAWHGWTRQWDWLSTKITKLKWGYYDELTKTNYLGYIGWEISLIMDTWLALWSRVYKRMSLSKLMSQLNIMILKCDSSIYMICLLRYWLYLIEELV